VRKNNGLSGLLILSMSLLALSAMAEGLNAEKIEKLTGLKGQMNDKEKVFKVSFPRTDLKVKAMGVALTPPMGLTGWAAFTGNGNQVMMMGDTVLTEDQVNPVMSIALENGLEVTALHNHFFGDAPKVMFMHIGGMGTEEALASAVGKVYGKGKETIAKSEAFPVTDIDSAQSAIDPKPIHAVLGYPGELNKGIFKVSIGRETKMHGMAMGNAMGVNTWAAFAGTNEKAMVDGDFAVLENELQGVLKALLKANIQIVAIHNHMTEEKPRIIFLHYWGVGAAVNLAKGLRNALDRTKIK
jgi:hypothetical protein